MQNVPDSPYGYGSKEEQKMSYTNTLTQERSSPNAEPALNGLVDGVLEAYRREGYEAGYRRARNDLLADFVLISREFIRDLPTPAPELRQILRKFEQHLEGSMSDRSHFREFTDGLGI
jgi:hypothetical protein